MNGGFENTVKLINAGLFEWKIADGTEPQIGLIETQKRSGKGSLSMLFNSYKAVRFRSVSQMIAVLPDDFMGQTTLTMLGALGANQLALQQAEKMEAAGTTVRARMWLWYPSMAGALRDPSFPGVAQRLGLMRYWKTTHTKPDVCSAKDPPPFCRMI